MKNILLAAAVTMLAATATPSAAKKPKPIDILVFSKTNGFRHASITDGIKALGFMATENGWKIAFTEDSLQFNTKNLAKYDVLVLLSPTGNVWGSAEKAALTQYVKKGGGIVGIHAATDCQSDWPWYNQMIGGTFESHPSGTPLAQLDVVDTIHLATKHLKTNWVRKDEWYNFKNLQPDNKVLLTIDETTYEGGKNGNYHPMSWYKIFEGGRIFYTALGHTPQSYTEPLFVAHLRGGILYAAGSK
ncbi:MAG: ThuA domain-containing protein [Bacteroidetes bacterium]|nr:MAG: ThuA domain-containing protein [Bacteroidota bacterium]